MLLTVEPGFGMECEGIRKNTVRCDFGFLKRDLTVLELHNFVEHFLELQPEQLKFLQWNGIERCLYMRLSDLITAKRLVAINNRRHSFPEGSQGSRVALKLVDVPADVLLFDLSELVTDEQVKEVMEEFGVVLAIGHSHWGPGVRYAGISSGQRLVRMVIRKALPRYVRIGNELSTIGFNDQEKINNFLGFRMLHNVVRGWRFMGRVVRSFTP
ncbi:uncharacterized protein LOC128713349 [Anopheles marshallii]|uniref:uncharacterized protein LOC128713349 n=1 Tax=Anopheles marshallii TaxID=1521116 RepID=UPI00237BDF1E|nr:uncharacterized protein LOC128713349 [Anopheles marshallii]